MKEQGWVTAPDGQERFHFGAWLAASGRTVQSVAEHCGADPGLVSRWARYERHISNKKYKRPDAEQTMAQLLFSGPNRIVRSASYADYEASWQFFHDDFTRRAQLQDELLGAGKVRTGR